MVITENGAWIKLDERYGTHHGIENKEMRAKRIGGELTINNLDKGTSVTLVAKNI